jgi:hypothetical protein
MRMPWAPGTVARVYLVVGVLVAMVAALLVRMRGADLTFDYRQSMIICAAGGLTASVTLADWKALAAGYVSYVLAYVVVFPLLLAATRTESTIELALFAQVQIAQVAAVWAGAAAVIFILKLLLLRWVLGSRFRDPA